MAIDEKLKHRVMEALEPLNLDRVDVGVHHGVVTLTGQVDTATDRTVAEHTSRQVVGVQWVRNWLQIRLAAATDSDEIVFAAARHALCWNMKFESEHVHCKVSQGRIILEGNVLSQAAKAAAEQAVRRLSQCHCVVNDIQVSATF